jgi:hypothetical protein
MTIIDEERLRGLAAVAARPAARPLDEVRARAGRLRRRRRAARGGAGVAAVLAVALVVPAVVGPGTPLVPLRPTALPRIPECNGVLTPQPLDSVPARVLYLMSLSPERRPITRAQGGPVRYQCPSSLPQAVLVDLGPGGRTVRALQITGPAAGQMNGDSSITRVHGRAARLITQPGQRLNLWWSEPDGSTWRVDSSGIAAADLARLVEALRFSTGRVAPSSLPKGYDLVRLLAPIGSRPGADWEVWYGRPATAPTEVQNVRIQVDQPAAPVESTAAMYPPGAVTFTQVRGHRAALYLGPFGRAVNWEAVGLSFTFIGPYDPPDLIERAGRLIRVDADDPRLAGFR